MPPDSCWRRNGVGQIHTGRSDRPRVHPCAIGNADRLDRFPPAAVEAPRNVERFDGSSVSPNQLRTIANCATHPDLGCCWASVATGGAVGPARGNGG